MEDDFGAEDEFMNLISDIYGDDPSCSVPPARDISFVKQEQFVEDAISGDFQSFVSDFPMDQIGEDDIIQISAEFPIPPLNLASSDDLAGVGGRRKRPRQQDDEDAKIIAAETERHLKKLNIDPDSKEGKAERRKIQNRMSAQMHRERKRAYIESLEDDVKSRDETIAKLMNHIKYLEDRLKKTNTPFTDLNFIADSASSSNTTSESDSDESAGDNSSERLKSFSNRPKGPLGISIFSVLFLLSFGSYTLFNQPHNTFDQSSRSLDVVDKSTWQSSRILLSSEPFSDLSQINDDDEVAGSNAVFSSPLVSIDNIFIDKTIPEKMFSPMPIENNALKKKKSPVVASSLPVINSSLWTYDEQLLQFYPLVHNRSGENERTRPASRTVVTPNSSLRGASSEPILERGLVTAAAASVLPYFEKAERPINIGTPTFINPNRLTNDIDFASKIVMTSGKALLDPSLLSVPAVQNEHNNFGYEVPVHNSKNSRGVHADRALIVPQTISHDKDTTINSSPVPTTAFSQQFLMLLPLSSVQWGTSWDSSSTTNPLQQLLQSLKQNSNFEMGDENFDHENGVGNESLWIEIGCNIVRAQLVRNVTMI